MNLPGFTAETSIYRTRGRYWTVPIKVSTGGIALQQGPPPGVSTECLDWATDVYRDCVDECKGSIDPFICCGECELAFANAFDLCCFFSCWVYDDPTCWDDSGPGCAGGVILPEEERPEWCKD
jgi:hypothetical protein